MSSRAAESRRLLAIAVGTAALVVLAFVLGFLIVGRPPPPASGDEVLAAVRRFCAAHQPPPGTVTFSQLISEGYLDPKVLKAFGATEVTVYLKANETSPQMLLLDALMPDGSHTALTADGSVQGYSQSTFPSAPSNASPASPLTSPLGSARVGTSSDK